MVEGSGIAEGFVRAGARVRICSRKEQDCREKLRGWRSSGSATLVRRIWARWKGIERSGPPSISCMPGRRCCGLARMIRAGVINVGSIDALHVPDHEAYAYSSSKAEVHHLSRHMAAQLAPSHITVNVIAHGRYRSQMPENAIKLEGAEEMPAPVLLKRFATGPDLAGRRSICPRAPALSSWAQSCRWTAVTRRRCDVRASPTHRTTNESCIACPSCRVTEPREGTLWARSGRFNGE